MAFDWATSNSTWENAFNPRGGANGADAGAGYAVSDHPEGPWVPSAHPFLLNSRLWQKPILGKYRRFYATTLLRRRDDWLILVLTDSAEFHSWGLVCATAKEPVGPWSALRPLLHTEDDRYHPPTCEFFPAFVHEGFAYAPATSVAGNRNYQVVFRGRWSVPTRPGPGNCGRTDRPGMRKTSRTNTTASGVRPLPVEFAMERCGSCSPAATEAAWARSTWRNDPGQSLIASRGSSFLPSAAPQVALLRDGYHDFALSADLRLRGDVSLLSAHWAPLRSRRDQCRSRTGRAGPRQLLSASLRRKDLGSSGPGCKWKEHAGRVRSGVAGLRSWRSVWSTWPMERSGSPSTGMSGTGTCRW